MALKGKTKKSLWFRKLIPKRHYVHKPQNFNKTGLI